MKRSNAKGLVIVLVALMVLTFISPAIVSADSPSVVPTTLAIEVGSSTTRMSVIIGDNSQPKLISVGPGTHSAHGPLESNWTTEGYLSIKYGTDESFYVHPSNALFNLDHPVALRAKHRYNNRPRVTGYQALTLIDITAKYLKELKTSAETVINQNFTFVSIVLPGGNNIHTTAEEIINDRWRGNYTLYDPVYAGGIDLAQGQRDAMWKATKAAGLGLFRSYRKSSAAAFSFRNDMEHRQGALVYRLGSSTFLVSVLERDYHPFGVLSSVYDQHLGGNDFSQRVVDHLLLAHKTKTHQDLSNNNKFVLRLGHEVEKAKRALSFQNSVRIEIESLRVGDQGLSEELTRSQFEELNMDLFMKTITAVDQALRDSVKFAKEDIQHIIFSGGSANIPFLQSAIKDYFGHPKNYYGSKQPETTVVFGAAKSGQQAEHDMHRDRSGVCCFGARYLSVGIETAGGVMVQHADYISAYEFDKVLTFSTAVDNQERVVIRVYEGERATASQNVFLGDIELSGIPPAPKGVPQIRVRMSAKYCDTHFELTVMDVATERTNTGTISRWTSFAHDKEIDKKMSEGKAFENEDRLIWENAEAAGTMTLLPEY
ncbi:ATPase with role in protein import into the ER [Mortierella sp. AD031]|nr:ATPase with role in protein import into the ER [Mortierella sp. AD031]